VAHQFTYTVADETLDHHRNEGRNNNNNGNKNNNSNSNIIIQEEHESLDDQPVENEQEHNDDDNAEDGDNDDDDNGESPDENNAPPPPVTGSAAGLASFMQQRHNGQADIHVNGDNRTAPTESETWSFDGTYDTTPKSSVKKSFLPPKPPVTATTPTAAAAATNGNNNNSTARAVSWTDDNASVGQSIASSTFGEDRQTVTSQIIVDPYGDKGIYSGVILRSTGMPHGSGKMRYQEDNRTYDGEWRHGRWHGHGKATFANGDSYVGEYRYDQR
jgi:hypothetical protein